MEACRAAVENKPEDPRFRYQYARAMQTIEPASAAHIYEQLVAERYPAAFDNYGWVLIQLQNDYAGAERLFRAGIALDNADARQSLAELIIKNRIRPRYKREAVDLMREAAEQGNADARTYLAEYDERKRQENEAKAVVKGIFGSILRGATGR